MPIDARVQPIIDNMNYFIDTISDSKALPQFRSSMQELGEKSPEMLLTVMGDIKEFLNQFKPYIELPDGEKKAFAETVTAINKQLNIYRTTLQSQFTKGTALSERELVPLLDAVEEIGKITTAFKKAHPQAASILEATYPGRIDTNSLEKHARECKHPGLIGHNDMPLFSNIYAKPGILTNILSERYQRSQERIQFIKEVTALMNNVQSLDVQQLSTQIKSLESRYPPSFFNEYAPYWPFKNGLHERLNPPLPAKVDLSLSELMTQMSPLKMKEFCTLLAMKPFQEALITSLYDAQDASPEAQAFNQFFKTHQINFLGGNNALNYQVIDGNNNKQILKIDHRLDRTQHAEVMLRDTAELREVFLPVHASRLVPYTDAKGEAASGFLSVTEYCPNKDLSSYLQTTAQQLSGDEKIKLLTTVYSQMAEILEHMSDQGILFSDAKNANWLLRDNSLCLADTKSLFEPENARFGETPMRSPGYIPPEFNKSPLNKKDIEAAHAWILGQNFWNLASVLIAKENPRQCGLNFETSRKQLVEMCKSLMQNDPSKRPTLNDVKITLKRVFEACQTQTPAERIDEFKKKMQEIQKTDDMVDEQHRIPGNT